MYFSIILPTYNESENIKKLIPEIQANFANAEIIVVDDNFPDSTAKVAEALGVRVINRSNKEGLGAALKQGYDEVSHDIIISMDADNSIAVQDIGRVLEKLKTNDLVVGSKYSKNSQSYGFSSKRQKILSYLGNKFFIALFRLPVDDVTLNLRGFTKKVWQQLCLREKSNVFLLEMLIEAKAKNLRIAQIPIVFSAQDYGESKTNLKKLFPLYLKFLLRVIEDKINKRLRRKL